MKNIISQKIFNILKYLENLNNKIKEKENKNYLILIDDEINFYKTKLIEYTTLYVSLS